MNAKKLMVSALKADQAEYKTLRKELINLARKIELEELPFSMDVKQTQAILAMLGEINLFCSKCIRDLESHMDDVENE